MREAVKRLDENPCRVVYGPGPDGAQCGGCALLHRGGTGGKAGLVFKCDLRVNTSGAGSDHRAGWPACGRFEIRRAT